MAKILWGYVPKGFKIGDEVICVNEKPCKNHVYKIYGVSKGDYYNKTLVRINDDLPQNWWNDDNFELYTDSRALMLEIENIL